MLNTDNTLFTLPESETTTDDVLVSESIKQTLSNKKFKDSNNNEYAIDEIPKLNTENTFTANIKVPSITLNNTDLQTTLNNCAKLNASNTFTGKLETTQTTPNNALGDNLKAVIRDFIYPVGAVYISFVKTSPATLFGGTWEQITDRFLYCANSAGTTKGSSTHTHNNTVSIKNASHTLTINQIPSHNHSFKPCMSPINHQNNSKTESKTQASDPGSWWCNNYNYVDNTGGGQGHTHNNTVSITNASGDSMPPYITCYCWQRKA